MLTGGAIIVTIVLDVGVDYFSMADSFLGTGREVHRKKTWPDWERWKGPMGTHKRVSPQVQGPQE